MSNRRLTRLSTSAPAVVLPSGISTAASSLSMSKEREKKQMSKYALTRNLISIRTGKKMATSRTELSETVGPN